MAKSLLIEGTVHVLVCLFGISSWIAINGLWVETPIIVNVLPEKWKLASHISIVTHFASLGPIIYSLGLKFISRSVSFAQTFLLRLELDFYFCLFLNRNLNRFQSILSTELA